VALILRRTCYTPVVALRLRSLGRMAVVFSLGPLAGLVLTRGLTLYITKGFTVRGHAHDKRDMGELRVSEGE